MGRGIGFVTLLWLLIASPMLLAQDPPAESPEPPANLDAAWEGIRADVEATLFGLRDAVEAQSAEGVWQRMTASSQSAWEGRVRAWQSRIRRMPEDLRATSPPEWDEADTLADALDATPQEFLGIWLRSASGARLADELARITGVDRIDPLATDPTTAGLYQQMDRAMIAAEIQAGTDAAVALQLTPQLRPADAESAEDTRGTADGIGPRIVRWDGSGWRFDVLRSR